jgi:hypothetical protein
MKIELRELCRRHRDGVAYILRYPLFTFTRAFHFIHSLTVNGRHVVAVNGRSITTTYAPAIHMNRVSN